MAETALREDGLRPLLRVRLKAIEKGGGQYELFVRQAALTEEQTQFLMKFADDQAMAVDVFNGKRGDDLLIQGWFDDVRAKAFLSALENVTVYARRPFGSDLRDGKK